MVLGVIQDMCIHCILKYDAYIHINVINCRVYGKKISGTLSMMCIPTILFKKEVVINQKEHNNFINLKKKHNKFVIVDN